MTHDSSGRISRREALQRGALGAASFWAATRSRLAFAAARVPIGVQLYSVRKDCERDLAGTLRALKGFGYEGVEFAGYYGRSAVELRKLLDENGLRCCGTHTGLETLEGDALARTIEFNQAIGNHFLIVPSIPEERRKTAADWKALAARFDELASEVAPHGMRVGYHNHDFEFRPLDGSTAWDLFIGGTNKAVVMQLDTGNCLEGGGDPVALLKRYSGRAASIHAKEYSKTKPDAFLGEGDVPWKAVFEACEVPSGIQWYIVEYEHESQPALPAVDRCLQNLRALRRS